MTTSSNQTTNSYSFLFNALSWLLGIAFIAIGIINTFYGNDPGFGIFIILMSLIYFPPVNQLIRLIFGFTVPAYLKVFLAFFTIWAALGVGELLDKIELMRGNF